MKESFGWLILDTFEKSDTLFGYNCSIGFLSPILTHGSLFLNQFKTVMELAHSVLGRLFKNIKTISIVQLSLTSHSAALLLSREYSGNRHIVIQLMLQKDCLYLDKVILRAL